MHKVDNSKFLVHYDDIAADAEIVILDSVSSIDSVCIAVNTGEVLLLHSTPYEVQLQLGCIVMELSFVVGVCGVL